MPLTLWNLLEQLPMVWKEVMFLLARVGYEMQEIRKCWRHTRPYN
jgi:hypothetical protein